MFLAKDELERGCVYRIRSRNLIVGMYDGDEGFIGVREKFGDEYLFTEYLARELGGTQIGLDTVRPVEKIGRVRGNAATEHYGLICTNCGKGSWRDEGGSWPDNEHCAGGCSNDERSVMWTMNQLLFDVLRAMEEPIRQQIAAEFPPIERPGKVPDAFTGLKGNHPMASKEEG